MLAGPSPELILLQYPVIAGSGAEHIPQLHIMLAEFAGLRSIPEDELDLALGIPH